MSGLSPPAAHLGWTRQVSLVAVRSPLSLVPGFEADAAALGGVKRDDSLKLRPYGLTRITRHPLILPVVPWGVANALLAGAHPPDLVVFLGLAARSWS